MYLAYIHSFDRVYIPMLRNLNTLQKQLNYVKKKEFSYWKIKKGHLKKRDVGSHSAHKSIELVKIDHTHCAN